MNTKLLAEIDLWRKFAPASSILHHSIEQADELLQQCQAELSKQGELEQRVLEGAVDRVTDYINKNNGNRMKPVISGEPIIKAILNKD